jgi:hypothetical protein
MNKQAIITILFALVAIAGYGQSFTPIVEDSIDFVITGTTTSTNDSVCAFPCAPYEPGMKFPIRDGKFTVTGRMPRNSFVQIGDNAGNDLRFIVDNVPTDINLVTGEVKGSDLQQRFIRCQMREREIYKVAITWDKSFNKEEKARIMAMVAGDQPMQTATDTANVNKYNSLTADIKTVYINNIRQNLDNIIPAWYLYLYTGIGSFIDEQMDEFMHEDAPYAHHPAMERPWKMYYSMKKQRAITGKSFIDFEAEAPDGTKHHLSEYVGHGK